MGVYIDGNRVYGLKEARKLLGFETLPQFRRYLAKIGFIEINHKGSFSRSKHVIYKSNKKRGQWGHSVKLFITQDGLNELQEMRCKSLKK